MSEEKGFSGRIRGWMAFLAFAAGYLALRIFWIDCDSGIGAVWEYGFHVTDEGYYLGGGKEKYLWGAFVDLSRSENLSYGYSAGTHWLSYFAHLVFGLSTWTWRIPFVAIYFLAWMMTFRFISVRRGGLFAFLVCFAVSSVPLVVVYERGASNDMLIGALLMISYVLAAGKGAWRIFVSAAVMGYIITVKPSVWAFIPIVLSGVLDGRKFRSKWIDGALFTAASVAAIYSWYALMGLTVVEQAREAGISPFKVLKLVHANYGLPSVTDVAKDLICASTFPRDPSGRSLSSVAILITVVPAALFILNALRRNFSHRMFLYLGIPVYVAGLTLINTQYTHYYLPMIVMTPFVFSAMVEDFGSLASAGGPDRKVSLAEAALLCAATATGLTILFTLQADPKTFSAVYSRVYNLPPRNVWTATWPLIAAVTAFGTTAVAMKRGFHSLKKESWAWVIVFFAVASVSFALYPGYAISPYIKIPAVDFMAPMALSLVTGMVFSYVIFVRPRLLADARVVSFIPVAVVLSCYLAVPMWRRAAVELVRKGTYVQARAAEELKKHVPADAVVLGERSNQIFMSLPVRTATTFISNSNPFPVIDALRKKDPAVKLYAVIDTQHAYMLGHFRKNSDKCSLELVKTVKLPSFATGEAVDVHLCRLHFPETKKRR